ncbi:DUF2231 domain-containing protein [Thermomonas sp.]|uniref:DUF2231 domain-containing protein n=1 Tax=Thermomonas sp. TaxID=1971895 RepID=UPI002489DE49|nr:DUF2231 domain-containing protein [Thermomonas sp.]MDI1252243.1 DUF2231 domain-containing protein [Thermomonas sp.]
MKHPLHPALVHFPIACWSLATLADIVGQWSTRWPFWQWSVGMLVVGCAAGLAAAGAGLLDFLKLSPEHPATADAYRHMGVALTAWSLYAFSLLLRMDGMQPAPPNGLALALSGLGFIALCTTGWLGGKLVYVYGVGAVGPRS